MAIIFVLIAIGMAAILSLATLWWGGGLMVDKSVDAEAVRAINGLSQIRAAVALSTAEGGGINPTSLDQIMPRYLRSMPAGWTTGQDALTGYLVFEGPQMSDEVCMAVNEGIGIENEEDAPPRCADIDPETNIFLGCCTS